MEKFVYELNIGLNNNPFTYSQLVNRFGELTGVHLIDKRLDAGQYDGQEEPTAVLLIMHNSSQVESAVQKMCEIFTQECIAMRKLNDSKSGILIYPEYVYERLYEFDEKYFIPFFKHAVV